MEDLRNFTYIVVARWSGGTTTRNAVNGVEVFDDLFTEGGGIFVLAASSDGLETARTEPFSRVQVIELVVPRFIQGGRDAEEENLERVPFAYLLRIDGLTPQATCRYGNRVVRTDEAPAQNGAGNMIFVTGTDTDWIRNTAAPRFRDSDFGRRHYTFVSDGDGSHTGWFVTEPTGNQRFTPGETVFMRLLLNDGADGEETAY